jgi:hypothetical protein
VANLSRAPEPFPDLFGRPAGGLQCEHSIGEFLQSLKYSLPPGSVRSPVLAGCLPQAVIRLQNLPFQIGCDVAADAGPNGRCYRFHLPVVFANRHLRPSENRLRLPAYFVDTWETTPWMGCDPKWVAPAPV